MIRKLNIPPVWFAVSLITIIILYFLFRESLVIPFPINLIGFFFVFFGFGIMSKARDLFKKHKTPFDFENPIQLIDEGIFSKTRNPMYVGMFLILFGLAICFKILVGLIVPFVFMAIIQVLIIPGEEKTMEQIFGQNYLTYKSKVSRWINI